MLPLVSPQVVSKRQPFPFLNNGELYIVTQLESKKGKRKMGIVSCSAAFDERFNSPYLVSLVNLFWQKKL